MSLSRGARRRLLAVPLGVLMVALAVPASGQEAADPFAGAAPFDAYGFQGEGEARLADLDARAGVVPPSAAAQRIAADLGADQPRWNDFGTPHVLFDRDGALAGPREGAAVDVARAFVRDNAALFRLDADRVDALEVTRDAPLYDSPDLGRVYREGQPPANPDVAHVITFRQRFDGLEAASGGLLTVGVTRDGSVVWVTSSVTGDSAVTGEQQLTALQAVQQAAADVDLDLGELVPGEDALDGAQTFASRAAGAVQRAHLVALPTPTEGVRRVWGVSLLDDRFDEHGNPSGFVVLVDAESGKVWQRVNKLEHLAAGAGPATLALPSAQAAPSGGSFSGTTDQDGCGAPFEFEVPEGTGQITVEVQSLDNPNADTVLADLVASIVKDGEEVATGDTLGNPEVATHVPTEAGTYGARACNFSPADPAFEYTGNYLLTPVGGGGGGGGGEEGTVKLPTWRVFPANPPFVSGLDPETTESEDTRVLWCWDIRTSADCAEQQRNAASRVPWDVNPPNVPSLTTDGNNASTAVSEVNFQAPDTVPNRPVSPDRDYDYPWNNAWFEGSCDPTQFGAADPATGGPNDESASTANLFVMHNRMHDWSYYLGFTETNANMQKSNFGNTGPELENDPELGSSQAGRRSFNGRDNANQRTMGDGIAPITNQYLWQPLAGAFYAPCVDGAYDQAVVAHEYGHAITNRMIGGDEGPLGGTGPTQGQTESWSDLQFAAYFTEFAISAGEGVNPYVLGPYVTGDPVAGIRNYAMNQSPLNYSGLDYDPVGIGSPHANGEIWSATNFDVLEALNAKYDGEFPSTDAGLQNACARGEKAAEDCPGNRRWNQIQYDSYLIQPSGSTMVDSRDAMLAGDLLRFDGANQEELWTAFAARGLGTDASASDAGDVESQPSFTSPLRDDEAVVRFTAPAGVSDMRVFAGRFEARAVPVADTITDTSRGDAAAFVPGSYEFVAQAPGHGFARFTLTLAPGSRTVEVPFRRNLASTTNGATIAGDGVNLEALIDDTEETNWASFESAGTASEGKGEGQQVEGRQVVVDLAGDAPVDVREVTVSAALRPPAAAPEEDEELPSDPDPGTQSRFSALRSFDVLACNAGAGADCSKAAGFTQIFASSDDAFPSTRPRPRIPDFLARPFDVTDVQATHLKLVVRDSQCTGGPDFQGESNPDNDPLFDPDCDTEAASPDREVLSPPVEQVRAAELQVFGAPAVNVDAPDGTTPGGVAPGMPTTTAPAGEQPTGQQPTGQQPTGQQPTGQQPGQQAPGQQPAQGALTAQARGIAQACPDDRVPRGSRQDTRGNTHERAIDCMIWYEIAQGFDAQRYGPFVPVSRAQMASFVARQVEVSGGSFPAGRGNAFSDDEGSVHEASIDKLASVRIVNGTGSGRFDPRGLITRDQMASFLVKAYEYRAGRTISPRGDYFGDDAGNTHELNINKSAEAGFTGGRDGGYQPREVVNRDAMASFLARSLDLLVEQGVAQAKR